ncbi:MAG: sugar phosphorylase [Anaerolineae bacterium]|nr:sugar phosphorylase [Anaerolineae bacterium]
MQKKNKDDLRALMRHDLEYLYGPAAGQTAFKKLSVLLDQFPGALNSQNTAARLTQKDSILITYGDQINAPDLPPLAVLNRFCLAHLQGLVSGIHLLPFYPYSSDDGFSVIDYRQVDSHLGDWSDIGRLGQTFKLMFDAVINHISAQSDWFKAYLRDDPVYCNFFIETNSSLDLSRVVRPRTLPLLTPFTTPSGIKSVWTTFSDDQIDLNYANPDVLLEIIAVLLFYIGKGAGLIRLDAIAYLWKEIGTTCIHLPQTHRVIQLLRTILDEVSPQVALITETNVPHADNIAYFGGERAEAQLVYNFALPPLVLHTLRCGNARALSGWASALDIPKPGVTFFNFLASHDGIGLNPARGILSEAEIDALVQGTLQRGGWVSSKNNPDGSTSPYEMNINYFDALNQADDINFPGRSIARFMLAQSIMLALVGMPGIYFHSLFGSHGWPEGVKQSGRARTVNRQKLDLEILERELADETCERNKIFASFSAMLSARAASSAFDPFAGQSVLNLDERIFAIQRSSTDGSQKVLCLFNVSDTVVNLPNSLFNFLPAGSLECKDLISGKNFSLHESNLSPYQVLWLDCNDRQKGGTG